MALDNSPSASGVLVQSGLGTTSTNKRGIMREQYIATGKQYATNSESMRAQAQLFRNLGDNVTAEKWEKQAQAEEQAGY